MPQVDDVFLQRVRVVVIVIAAGFLLLLSRAVDLTVFRRDFLQSHSDALSIRDLIVHADRGPILDRNGNVLALSTPVTSVWMVPDLAKKVGPKQWALLAKTLKLSPEEITAKLQRYHGRSFVYLKRQMPPTMAPIIKALRLPGIYVLKEYKRFYPTGEITAPLLGFTDIDDKGIEGLEYGFESYLNGQDGRQRVIRDRDGRVVETVSLRQSPHPGKALRLTIDNDIQFLSFNKLKATVKRYRAESGSVVVLDVVTGELLALANYPSFNPNQPVTRRDPRYRNRALTDTFEPGSVIKPFTIASAMQSRLFTPNTIVDTSPGWLKLDGNLIRDDIPYDHLSVTEILKRSSNVGVSKLVLSSSAMDFIALLQRVGFGHYSQTHFPGESRGRLEVGVKRTPFELATMGFGYGLSVTPLQLAQAYAVFANHGGWMPARLVMTQPHRPSERAQVMTARIADQVLGMLEAVVSETGTGRRAALPGYRVAGKTGTARIANEQGYDRRRHIASFAGIAPVSAPQMIIVAVIRNPRAGKYYGGAVAAPLFRDILADVLRIKGVLPDEKKAVPPREQASWG